MHYTNSYRVLILHCRVIVDGDASGTVFNGPSPALDAMYTSTSNYITGQLHAHLTCICMDEVLLACV